MKKVLVTGGAGFLGSHICQKCIDLGCYVICLDNLSTGSKKNLSTLLKHPNFLFIEEDVINPLNYEVDEIYNFACPASPKSYQKDPIQTIRTSVLGAFSVCELAKQTNAKVLHASTSEVYGDPKEHPQKESYFGNVNFTGKRSCYDEGKRMAETIFYEYENRYHFKVSIARIFNTYGPNMHPDDGRVISSLIKQALLGQPMTIYGDGTQTRSFCFVSDLIDALVHLMQHPNFDGPVNLGNPCEITILTLAETIKELTKSPSEILLKELPQDDPKLRKPDISLAKKHLNFHPKVTLNEGLCQTIRYVESILRETSL